MIEVVIRLTVVSETDEAWWLGTCSAAQYRDRKEACLGSDAQARQDLTDIWEHQFIRVDKNRPIHEQISDRISYGATVRSVASWPCLKKLEVEV